MKSATHPPVEALRQPTWRLTGVKTIDHPRGGNRVCLEYTNFGRVEPSATDVNPALNTEAVVSIEDHFVHAKPLESADQ